MESDNDKLQVELAESARDSLGNCVSLEVTDAIYCWSPVPPDSADVRAFCDSMAKLNLEDQPGYIVDHLEELRSKRLVVDTMEDRIQKQSSCLKAFTVVKNVQLFPSSVDLLFQVLRNSLLSMPNGNGSASDKPTLYRTRGVFDFVIRWTAIDFLSLRKWILDVTQAAETSGAAAIFETFFVADRILSEHDNPRFRGARRKRDNQQDPEILQSWLNILPQLARIPRDKRDALLVICNLQGIELTPNILSKERQVKSMLEAYLSGSKEDFAAHSMAFCSNVETRLRNELLAIAWHPLPLEARDQCLGEWQRMLGRSTPIATGTDGGQKVPKVTLGDVLGILRQQFPIIFTPEVIHQMGEMSQLRNKLAHYGASAIGLDRLPQLLVLVRTVLDTLSRLQKSQSEIGAPQS